MDMLTGNNDWLTSFEKESYSTATLYAQAWEFDADTETAYFEVLQSARWQILQRLVGGLLRESPASLSAPVVCSSEEFTNQNSVLERATASLPDLDSESVRDSVRSLPDSTHLRPDSSSRVALLAFPTAETLLLASVADVHGFDRFRLLSPITSITPSSSSTITHPGEVVELLDQEDVFPSLEQAEKFGNEIAQSVANLALALFAKRMGALQPSSNEEQFDVTALDLTSLERLASVQAHPVHPCAKTRLGMDSLESIQYAAEFTETIDLRFVAIDEDYTFEATTPDEQSLSQSLRETFDGLETALHEALPFSASLDEYTVLPVHPWQFRHTLPKLFGDEYETGRIVPLPEYTYPATPLLSFRTLVPHGSDRNERLPHVKLPVDILKTSRLRVLPPEDVYNGPQFSDLLASIRQAESFDNLGFLSEFAGACYHPAGRPTATDESSETTSQLSALLRTNPYTHPLVGEGDSPVTVASLLATPVGQQRPVVCSLVEQFAQAEGFPSAEDAVYAFVEAYAEVLVPGLLRMMCKYGIGPEAHLQNTCIIFDAEGRPRSTLVRDFGGFRVHTPRLDQQGYSLDTYPDSDVEANRREMYEMYNALFQTHLGELLVALVQHFDVDEDECWNRIRRVAESTFDRLRTDQTVPDERIERDESKLFGESAERRALTQMRLLSEEKSLYHQVSNPLEADP